MIKTKILIFVVLFLICPFVAYSVEEGKMTLQDYIRIQRLKACKIEYILSDVPSRIYDQDTILRCSTMMTLVYAYESNYGKSYYCRTRKNCHGIYIRGQGFLTFDSYAEARLDFAKRYYRSHYKKDIPTFVKGRSMTDQLEYTIFITERYRIIYEELEMLYKKLIQQ